MKASQKSTRKGNISLRRKVSGYYYRFIFVLKLLFILFLSLILFTDLFKPYKDKISNYFVSKTAEQGFVLENVVIEGVKNTTYEDVIKSINSTKGDPIFAVNLYKIKGKLESLAWVQSAVVERQLPSNLYIAITERVPIAIWQFRKKLYLVDSEGNRITNYQNNGNFLDLIHIVGEDANLYAKSLADKINLYPTLAVKIKSAIRFGNRRWDLRLQEDITVKMPEHEFEEAYEYLFTLDKNDKLFNQGYKTLDLRDSKKHYIEKHK